MIISSLFVGISENKGRGVFTSESLKAGTLIEISPVIVMSAEDRVFLDKTLLHDYIFIWGKEETKCCVALGYVSLYNHDYHANAEYEMNYPESLISITTVRDIKKGREIFINYNGKWNNTTPVWFDLKTK